MARRRRAAARAAHARAAARRRDRRRSASRRGPTSTARSRSYEPLDRAARQRDGAGVRAAIARPPRRGIARALADARRGASRCSCCAPTRAAAAATSPARSAASRSASYDALEREPRSRPRSRTSCARPAGESEQRGRSRARQRRSPTWRGARLSYALLQHIHEREYGLRDPLAACYRSLSAAAVRPAGARGGAPWRRPAGTVRRGSQGACCRVLTELELVASTGTGGLAMVSDGEHERSSARPPTAHTQATTRTA